MSNTDQQGKAGNDRVGGDGLLLNSMVVRRLTTEGDQDLIFSSA